MIPLATIFSQKKLGITLSSLPFAPLFETNFANDTGYSVDGTNLFDAVNTPSGFDAVKSNSGTIKGHMEVTAEGISGSNALGLKYNNFTQPTMSLLKHVSGSLVTGYDKLYCRYNVRLPNTWAAGGADLNTEYWKWMRIWQNTNPANGGTWTGSRGDAFSSVLNFSGQNGAGPTMLWSMSHNDNQLADSNAGHRQSIDWYKGLQGDTTNLKNLLGYFEHVGDGDWAIDRTLGNEGNLLVQPQEWHTIEVMVQLASNDTADDGVLLTWFDGVDQGPPTRFEGAHGAPDKTGVPLARHTSGMNCVVFFDNMVSWNDRWEEPGVDGRILINDLVISTERIGHSYVAGNTDNTGVGAT